MKLLYDARMLYSSGIGRYLQNLLLYVVPLLKQDKIYLTGDPDKISYFFNSNFKFSPNLQIIKWNSLIYSFSEQIKGSYLLEKYKNEVDVIHIPHYNVPYFMPKNSIVTIHDLIHFIFPEYFKGLKVKIAKMILENAVKKSCKIIVVSEATAQDLIKLFPFADSKIRIVYEAAADIFRPVISREIEIFKKRFGLKKYILYVGNRKLHKNLNRLLHAYSNLHKHIVDLQLVIAGSKFMENDEVTQYKQKHGLNNIIELERISDQDLIKLYCGAEALVFPSLYEGFGLPPLEAMACGIPVVVSKVASIPEVVGDAGIYVNPYDVDDITRGIYSVLINEDLRKNLRIKGFERSKMFTWKKTAQKTMAIYEEVLNEITKNK
ncbi:MAG: glycosyltransferase family 4 protein [Bacillota bacterium]